jgi:hypothetical protein
MIHSRLFVVPFVLVAGCTSVKVDRLAQEKWKKIPAKQVQQVSAEEAKKKPNTKVAVITLSTHSPFASDLHAIAQARTGKLGGNAYVVTASDSHTTVEGGFFSLFGDKSSAAITADALRWQQQPEEPAPKKPTGKRRHWYWF